MTTGDMRGYMKQLILSLFLCAAAFVSAADYVFDLPWQDSGFSENLRSDRERNEPFAKEPDSSGGRSIVVRSGWAIRSRPDLSGLSRIRNYISISTGWRFDQ